MFGELTNADGGIIVLLLTFFFRKFDLQNLYLIFFLLGNKEAWNHDSYRENRWG